MKPRIWWSRWANAWCCARSRPDVDWRGGYWTGATPREAFENWLRDHNLLLAAALF